MKKKIVLTLCLITLIFSLGGAYIIINIATATSELDYLLMLHRVEILREHLLLQIQEVQTDLILINTHNARSKETVIENVRNMKIMANACSDCHHSIPVMKRLDVLDTHIETFVNSFAKSLDVSRNPEKLEAERSLAFKLSGNLMTELNTMVHMASSKLESKTSSSLKDIARTRFILYIIISITPLIAVGLGFFFIRGFTKPVKVMLDATRRLKNGELDFKVEGLKDECGEVAASFNEMSNSLKQKMIEVEESQKRYQLLFESAGDAIFIIEAEGDNMGNIVEANLAAAEMHGYTNDEMLKLNLIRDLDAPDASEEAPERVKQMLNGEWITAEIHHVKKDGTIFPVELSAGLLEYQEKKYFLAIDRDISERKKLEKQILKSKQDWEDTFDTITDMITIHDKQYNITRANRAAQKLFGKSFSETINQKCFQYYHGKDAPPENCRSCESLETGKPVSFEVFEPHLDKFLEVRAMPQFDSDNKMTGLIHIVRDITERKKVEASLQRAEQLKLVGEWAAGLAHEIKNPLAGIKASVEALYDEHDFSEENKSIVERAIEEIKRIEKLLKSLLNFAKPPKLQLDHINVNKILNKAIDISLRHPFLAGDNSRKINILTDFDPNIPKTMADPMQLQQVFLNLLFNGIEAMSDNGTLAIKTVYDKRNKGIKISISDTGMGIENGKLSDIFKPFFTTKRKGTGLGLAITRRLIEEHGGKITVQSKPEQGTEFIIFLHEKNAEKVEKT